MNKCFVVQPFDKGKFDTRYNETFKPAIIEAGLKPYRVDNDPSVEIPIDEIHKNINDAMIVFVEITTDNPNVWYELGYAFAKNKTVVMVSSDERTSKYPFDIQHRTIIKYNTQSAGAFEKCKNDIVLKIKALIDKNKNIENYSSSPIKVEGELSETEKVALGIIMANQITDEESYDIYNFKKAMYEKGYNELGATITLRKLISSNFAVTGIDDDYQNNEFLGVKLTDKGIKWMLKHENEFIIKIDNDDEDIPF